MKTGFKYLGILLLATIVISGGLSALLQPKDAYAYGQLIAKISMIYLAIPTFAFGLWIQSKRKKNQVN
jgi:hypothetical protein